MLLIYLLIMNIIGYFMIYIDKLQAKKQGAQRIPEKTLFIIIIMGGSVGSYVSMRRFHHKTKKYRFLYIYVMPLIMIIQAIISIKIIT